MSFSATVERHPQLIIGGLSVTSVFFLLACTFHDAIPVCHYLFGCDHGLH